MRNNRNLIVLLVVLVGLAAAYALTRDRRPQLDTTGGFVDLVEGQVSTDDVYEVSLTRSGSEVGLTLVQRDGEWLVSSAFDAPANLNKLRTLLGNLETVSGELRSSDPSVFDAYALDEGNAYHLSIRDESGIALVDLLIGKRGGQGCFVRRADSDEVLLADHNFLSDFGLWGDDRPDPEAKNWIELLAFEVEASEVASIEMRGEETVVMVKEAVEPEVVDPGTEAPEAAAEPAVVDPNAYEWRVTVPDRFVASRPRGDGVMNALTALRARNVVGDVALDEYELGDDARNVTVTTREDQVYTLRFGAKLPDDDTLVYFQVVGERLVWAMPSYVADNVFKTATELRSES